MSVASPTRTPSAIRPATSQSPEPMKVFEVGQWATEAPASASRARSRAVRWIAWPKTAPGPSSPARS